jgi:hypothetical protein
MPQVARNAENKSSSYTFTIETLLVDLSSRISPHYTPGAIKTSSREIGRLYFSFDVDLGESGEGPYVELPYFQSDLHSHVLLQARFRHHLMHKDLVSGVSITQGTRIFPRVHTLAAFYHDESTLGITICHLYEWSAQILTGKIFVFSTCTARSLGFGPGFRRSNIDGMWAPMIDVGHGATGILAWRLLFDFYLFHAL